MSTHSFFAPSARGTEPVLTAELNALGLTDVKPGHGGVSFAGTLEDGMRACLWSRVASRILLELASFPAHDADALYAGVSTVDWSLHLSPDETLAIDFTSVRSQLSHTQFGAQRTKDAVCDQLREKTGRRPNVQVRDPDIQLHVHVSHDAATLSLDLAGSSLHRRGYRSAASRATQLPTGTPAPLKETLAAAMLLMADWPGRAAEGAPFCDPLCGSGTLLVEAGWMAADIAPGLLRRKWGFTAWRQHQPELWSALRREADERRQAGQSSRKPTLWGADIDPHQVAAARASLEVAGLRAEVRQGDVRSLDPTVFAGFAQLSDKPGVLVTNPPYGERLGDEAQLGPLYAELGDVLRHRFLGWDTYVLTGAPDLAARIGLHPRRKTPLWNGAIECRLLNFPIANVAPTAKPAWRHVAGRSPGADSFANRLRKNLRHWSSWAQRENIYCYRVYDGDLPEYAVAVDLYEDAAHVQEYAPPATVDARRAEERLADVVQLVPEVLGISPDDVFVKQRRRQRPETQYGRQADEHARRLVREGSLRFWVNLSDYLDTGLYLDERRLRARIAAESAGKDMLNLYAYTATASVHAAWGGARTTTSVDLSPTYLAWAEENLAQNGFATRTHQLVQSDCLTWLGATDARFDLIFVAPPTFSNSKRTDADFDVQRDHVALLQSCVDHLRPGGTIYFSNHFRRFKMDPTFAAAHECRNITDESLPKDFARNARIHNAWMIR